VKPREERLRGEREETVRGCTVAPDKPVLPLETRRSAVALPTADSLNEGLVTARFDGVVPEQSDAVLAVCEQVDAPPGHGRGPVSAASPAKSVVDCANLPSIIRGPESSYPIRVGAVRDVGSPERGRGVLRASDKDPPSC